MSECQLDQVESAESIRLAGKYLTFMLGHEQYGVEILKVREIIGLLDVTPVPNTHDYVRGVLNLRGKIIPVVDPRVIFGMRLTPDTDRTCIIVTEVTLDDTVVPVGTRVDRVCEVAKVEGGEIEPPPPFGSVIDCRFILGIAKQGCDVKILLNIEQVIGVAVIPGLDE